MNIREVGAVTILDLAGRIVLGEETGALRDAVGRLLQNGKKNILLNLDGVGFIDSAGIGQLVASYVAARNRTGNLKLLKLQPRVKGVLQLTQVDTVLPSFADEPAAVASFSS
jgi:anti-sigma B factor antagonist